MTRYENKMYISDSQGNQHTYTREKKKKELIAEHESKIRAIRASLIRDERLGLYTPELRDKKIKEIAHREKLIENLKSNPYSHKKFKIKRRKMAYDKLRDKVWEIIQKYKARDVRYLDVENIAYELNVPTHQVEQVFQELNQKGIVSQARNSAPHDTNRNYFGGGPAKGWGGSLYTLLD